MWVMWLGPLVTLAFLIGLATAAVLVRLGRIRKPHQVIGALALPFGCAALPVAGLVVLSVASAVIARTIP
ncbi:hypothetical protein [Novosphingobium sp.]|jgi:hypothetical protein|uniref:hypothetical protein n=1 Tax=Novosphingobium sp. TaxID=1874826 RepID=UPI003D6CF0C9